jgi:hypothetical protein
LSGIARIVPLQTEENRTRATKISRSYNRRRTWASGPYFQERELSGAGRVTGWQCSCATPFVISFVCCCPYVLLKDSATSGIRSWQPSRITPYRVAAGDFEVGICVREPGFSSCWAALIATSTSRFCSKPARSRIG